MERTQLIARLLNELATARASIASSYLRLWPSEGRVQLDRPGSAGKTIPDAAPPANTERESGGDGFIAVRRDLR